MHPLETGKEVLLKVSTNFYKITNKHNNKVHESACKKKQKPN